VVRVRVEEPCAIGLERKKVGATITLKGNYIATPPVEDSGICVTSKTCNFKF
jgi:hypothetical protein